MVIIFVLCCVVTILYFSVHLYYFSNYLSLWKGLLVSFDSTCGFLITTCLYGGCQYSTNQILLLQYVGIIK